MKIHPEFITRTQTLQPHASGQRSNAAIIESAVRRSQAVYESLQRPLAPLSAPAIGFGLQRLALATIGRLSRGIGIGWKTGFDSGESLDHVYQNEARGITPLGRWIDRLYLDSPGWKGIRTRGDNLASLLDRSIAEQLEKSGSAHILDVACGGGRYVLETLSRHSSADVTAELRDASATALERARKLSAEIGLEDRVVIRQGNGFDSKQISSTAPRPDIAIVSGLFELFSSNEPIQATLGGLSKLLAPGGVLLYTNQPWHPQQEMIARVLPNRDGEPWIMRIRSQGEMDALARESGFLPGERLTDEHGIFTVTRAVRA